MSGIQMSLFEYFADTKNFTLKDAENLIVNLKDNEVKIPSIRARIYEGINMGLFKRVAKGVYTCTKDETTCLLLNGNGRDISFIESDSIDFIICDHPYDLKSLKGGNREFAKYECFQYEQKDFDEKSRVIKKGAFLVEFMPDRSEVSKDYQNQLEIMAETAGFRFYASVPWKKGNFKANTGRKVKDREQVLFFSKGKARALRRDAKKDLEDSSVKHYMSGTAKMLPPVFDYEPPSKAERIHQAQKPQMLIEEIIDLISVKGEIGMDQYAGSGVIGKAALERKRHAILIEKDKETYEKARRGLEKQL